MTRVWLVACLHVSSSKRDAVQTKVHSVPPKVQTIADTRWYSRSTDSGGTLPQKSTTGSWHMPERHNRILLGAGTEGGIKENQSEIQGSFFTRCFYTRCFSSDSVIWLERRSATGRRGATVCFSGSQRGYLWSGFGGHVVSSWWGRSWRGNALALSQPTGSKIKCNIRKFWASGFF